MKRGIVVIGSRGSQLALTQTDLVIAELKKVYPQARFQVTVILTSGDQHSSRATNQIPEQGMFVKEIEEALLDGRIDLAVHSVKDMPVKTPRGLALAAMPERADTRDVLVSRSGKLSELPKGATVGTGSPRRRAQLIAYRSDLKVVPIRGNVDTRLRKVTSGELDAVVVAAAGVLRLESENMITEYLPSESFLPAPGQGAMGIEIRKEDTQMAEFVAPINDEPTWKSVAAERAFLQGPGGGCRAPIGALAQVTGNTIKLRGMVGSLDGTRILRDSEEGENPEEVGSRLAKRMLSLGADELIKEAK